MSREKYESAEIEIITFVEEDVITASNGNGDNAGHIGDTMLPVIRVY